MQISKETMEIFKNFGAINNSMSVTEPSVLKTMSIAENIIGIADVAEEFPEFHLYNSVPFISIATMYDVKNIDFDFQEKLVIIKAKGTRTRIAYNAKDLIPILGNLKASEKYKAFDNFNANFDLTSDKVAMIQKAANILGLPDMTVKMKNGKGIINVTDDENPDSNDMKVAIQGEGDCDISMMVKNFIVVNGEYTVKIADHMLAQFHHKKLPLFYIIAAKKE